MTIWQEVALWLASITAIFCIAFGAGYVAAALREHQIKEEGRKKGKLTLEIRRKP